MKTGMLAALMALLASLTGCASPQANHAYPATALSSVTLGHGQQVAVLLDRDSAVTLDTLQRRRDQAGGRATPVATLDSRQAYAWLSGSMQQDAGQVTFYEDLDALLADRPDVIVLLEDHDPLASAGAVLR